VCLTTIPLPPSPLVFSPPSFFGISCHVIFLVSTIRCLLADGLFLLERSLVFLPLRESVLSIMRVILSSSPCVHFRPLPQPDSFFRLFPPVAHPKQCRNPPVPPSIFFCCRPSEIFAILETSSWVFFWLDPALICTSFSELAALLTFGPEIRFEFLRILSQRCVPLISQVIELLFLFSPTLPRPRLPLRQKCRKQPLFMSLRVLSLTAFLLPGRCEFSFPWRAFLLLRLSLPNK